MAGVSFVDDLRSLPVLPRLITHLLGAAILTLAGVQERLAQELEGLDGGPLRAVFIRAPWVEDCGPAVTVLAEVDGHPVAVRDGDVTAVAFHPELTPDDRLHRWLVEAASARRVQESAA